MVNKYDCVCQAHSDVNITQHILLHIFQPSVPSTLFPLIEWYFNCTTMLLIQ